jgi:hypothetical protein
MWGNAQAAGAEVKLKAQKSVIIYFFEHFSRAMIFYRVLLKNRGTGLKNTVDPSLTTKNAAFGMRGKMGWQLHLKK